MLFIPLTYWIHNLLLTTVFILHFTELKRALSYTLFIELFSAFYNIVVHNPLWHNKHWFIDMSLIPFNVLFALFIKYITKQWLPTCVCTVYGNNLCWIFNMWIFGPSRETKSWALQTSHGHTKLCYSLCSVFNQPRRAHHNRNKLCTIMLKLYCLGWNADDC